jgi:pectin lyase
MNFAAYTTNRNLIESGTALQTAEASGNSAENWEIVYVSDGVYQIVNMSDNKYLTASGESVSTASAGSGTSQQWKIEGVQKDFEGYYLYYKITSVSTGKSLTYYQGNNAVGLASYIGDGAQLWKLNVCGEEGFSANCKVSEGEKACDIGGALGKTVTASTADELVSYLDSTDPLTIVLTADIDMQNKSHTRIRDYKTIIGSYSSNAIYDSQFRTNDVYGATDDSPSDNIIIRNVDFYAVNVPNRILVNIWSSRNIWIDHCSFTSKLTYDRTGNGLDEVGKFIWINTPYDNYLDAKDLDRSPDFIGISYCVFTNRYWTVAYGTQNGETSRCRTTLSYNKWDKDVRRTPQIGNGSAHIYNNYYEGYDSGNGGGTSEIIGGEGSNIVSENCRFQSFEKIYPYCICAGGGSEPYRDSGSYYSTSSSSTPSAITVNAKVTSTWYPNKENYGYTLLAAYNTSNTDTKAFCNTYSGCFKSASKFKYITDSDMTKYAATKYASPFLTKSFTSKFGNMVTEFKAATLEDGAVYMIKNQNSGLYLDVDSAKAANGTNIQQWGATEAGVQNTFRAISAGDGYYYLYAQVGDKATYLVDVTGQKTTDGTNIEIYTNSGKDCQKFKFYQNSDGSYIILPKHAKDTECLAVESASTSSGANIIQWTVNTSDTSQHWILEKVTNTGCEMDTSQIYMFKNVNSQLYMNVAGGSTEDGTNIQQWGGSTDTPYNYNSFTLKAFAGGGNYYYIVSRLGNYCLKAESSSAGGNICLAPYSTKDSSMLFRFVKNPDGSYDILTHASKEACLVEVADASDASGGNVQQWTPNGNNCQKWMAETVTTTTTTTTTKKVTTTTTKAVTTTSTTVPVTTTPVNVIGDINQDSSVSASDLVMLQGYILGREKLTEKQLAIADINDDNSVDPFDLILLRNLLK